MHQFLARMNDRAFRDLDTVGHTIDLQGWVNEGFHEVLDIVSKRTESVTDLIMFEVGSWKGASANFIVPKLKPRLSSLVCIDTWLGAPEFYTFGIDEDSWSTQPSLGWPQVFYTFTKNMKMQGHDDVIVPFPISSIQAAEVLKTYDIKAHVIYVDASHEYEAVLSDLEAFVGLMHDGGILWGDDYGNDTFPGVAKAVDEFAAKHGLSVDVIGMNWLITLKR